MITRIAADVHRYRAAPPTIANTDGDPHVPDHRCAAIAVRTRILRRWQGQHGPAPSGMTVIKAPSSFELQESEEAEMTEIIKRWADIGKMPLITPEEMNLTLEERLPW